MNQAERSESFWRSSVMNSETAVPPAWSFGDSPELADELLELTLRGAKTAMASALWEFEADGDPLPQPGNLSIVLDGSGAPEALIPTTEVEITPFEDVSGEHDSLEGEGDGSLSYWRAEHERAWRRSLLYTRYEFDPGMLIVCEQFEVLFPLACSA